MKTITNILSSILILFPVLAHAASMDKVIIFTTQKEKGSMTAGANIAYTSSFEIAISNFTNGNLDLSKLCLEASSASGEKFALDTVDESLTKGILSPKKIVKGNATFSSKSDQVYKAAVISINPCKNQ